MDKVTIQVMCNFVNAKQTEGKIFIKKIIAYGFKRDYRSVFVFNECFNKNNKNFIKNKEEICKFLKEIAPKGVAYKVSSIFDK